jgi:fatty-acyl-CoA synthase
LSSNTQFHASVLGCTHLMPGLFSSDLEFIINDAQEVIFVDQTLVPIPILNRLAGKLPSVRYLVVLSNGQPMPDHQLDPVLDYEAFLGAESTDFA